jgi:vacuolar-type H+-ATPase subunit F/Vma7
MAKIAVVAEEDVATCFRLAGVKLSYSVKKPKDAADIVSKLAENKEVVIIVLTERIAEEIKPIIEKISKMVYPTVLTIPGKEGPISEKVSPLLDLVKRTIGVEIKI